MTLQTEALETLLKTIPAEPGVYKFLDENGNVIYVGKAKSLKARVSSYFHAATQHSGKTRLLVRKTHKVEFIITKTEADALLLENNLIKSLQPRFNINLKDDKSYPYIVIRKEPFPRIYPTRTYRPETGEYFGPYTSVGTMRATLALVKSLFKLRTCNLNLSEENIRKGKFKVCLEFHIGNCAAPCIGRQSVEDYQENVRQIKQILRGRFGQLREHLRRLMEESARRMAFEEAQEYKEMLEKLDRFRSQSAVMTQEVDEADIFFLDVGENNAILAYLKVAEGSVIQGFTSEVKIPTDEEPAGLMATLMMEVRTRYQSEARLIITNLLPEFDIPGARLEIPTGGEKKRMLDLAARNAHTYRLTRLKQLAITDPEQHTERLLSTVQKDLRLPVPPRRIECFDNSNFQGAHPVSAMVCFVNGRPARSEYRLFNIKTVTGPDDFATMREVLQRRYSRLLSEGQPLPDLIVIDGGKGQLNATLDILKALNLAHRISIISIAKRLEEIYYPGDELPLYLDKKSETLRLLQQLRDEAHRFGLRHYRQRHKKTLSRSLLEDIPGVGRSTAEKLLKAFKSVARLRQASKEEIAEIIGASRAQKICEALHSGPADNSGAE